MILSRCIFIGLSVLFLSCASGIQIMRQIDPGMSPQEVTELMGPRDSFRTYTEGNDEFVLYQWTNRMCNAHVSMYEKCDFFVIFKNAKVIETGTKDIRSNAPEMKYYHLFIH